MLYEEKYSSKMIGHVINAQQFQDICKALLCLALESTSTSYNYPDLISAIAQRLGFAIPRPIIFADTNWIRDFFGCVVNPGTGKFELWRVDCIGSSGSPMNEWKPWLDGSRRDITWGVYTRRYEYKG